MHFQWIGTHPLRAYSPSIPISPGPNDQNAHVVSGDVDQPPAQLKRADYKGERRRFSVRLAKKAVLDLEIIKIATGEDKNAFVERHLETAINAKLKELREKHGDEAWEFILARAMQRVG